MVNLYHKWQCRRHFFLFVVFVFWPITLLLGLIRLLLYFSCIATIVATCGRCETWMWHHVSASMDLFRFFFIATFTSYFLVSLFLDQWLCHQVSCNCSWFLFLCFTFNHRCSMWQMWDVKVASRFSIDGPLFRFILSFIFCSGIVGVLQEATSAYSWPTPG